MRQPTNACGYTVEHYTYAAGWEPCTEPVATRAEAVAQLARLDTKTHRVYWALEK